MSISFTQYLRPNGRQRPTEIDMPEEVEAIAHKFIEAGGKFESEELMTGHVSLTAVHTVEDEPQDIAIEVCANGPTVPDAVERLVRAADKWMTRSLPVSDEPLSAWENYRPDDLTDDELAALVVESIIQNKGAVII